MPTICMIAINNKAHHMRVYHRMCLSLLAGGYKIVLLAQDDGEGEFAGGIHFHPLGRYKASIKIRPAERLKRLANAFLIALRSKADIFQFTSLEFIPLAIILRKLTGKPVIFDCMEDYESYVIQRPGLRGWTRSALNIYAHYSIRLASQNIDAIITADPGTARCFHPSPNQILIIYNYPILRLFPFESFDRKTRYDLVFHGSMGRNNLSEIMKVDAELARRGSLMEWYLLGDIDEPEWFEKKLAMDGCRDRYFIGAPVPHNRVAAELRKANIGIIPLPDLPKYHNNIPQKLFEYMAMGMPIVMSRLPPSQEFVGDNACVFLANPGVAEDFADAILKIVGDRELCLQMRIEARRRIEESYNWQGESSKLLSLYADLCT